ncbi:MAG: hypothetical protein SWY16_09930 [Cyanobacteriota bacterium]|nr:hypothetical protein [Cyanobacteriota bacterium]
MRIANDKATRSMYGWLILLGLASALLSSCSELDARSQSQGASTETAASPVEVETPKPSAADATAELRSIIGTTEDGWLPKAVADLDLTSNTTPEALGDRLPGAQEVSNLGDTDEFVVSEVAVEDVPGVDKYKFTFQKDPEFDRHDLYSVTVIFEPALKSKLSYEQMAETLARKYGELEPAKIEGKNAFWIGPGFATASLTDYGTDFEGYELDVVVPD